MAHQADRNTPGKQPAPVSYTNPHEARLRQVVQEIRSHFDMPDEDVTYAITKDIAMFTMANWEQLKRMYYRDVRLSTEKDMHPRDLWQAAIQAQLAKQK